MDPIVKRLLYWTPRGLCVGFALFISMFALDVFSERLPFWRMLLALGMHLVPTAIIVVLLLLAWRWEWVGGVAFVGLGFYYMWMTHLRFPLSVYLVISGSAFLIALLFFANWIWRRELGAG